VGSVRRRNLLKLGTHFVWATHDRLPLVTNDIEHRLHRYIEGICQELGCSVIAIGGMSDHVHLLVAMSNKISTAMLMKNVKGSSSRFISSTLKPGSWFAWQPNYAAFSVSPSHIEIVVEYIANQKIHHVNGTYNPELEETDEEDPTGETA
jgi:REP element-mobilizing transposase RayT